ncbi:hypothetical protein DERP_012411 [Dermatophagoides pteronyssinus]|uniref:Uncharacterized protein n=1 Tax=Dermatophagoides pteronyssinus TaxID=6956 RepID=A0ABQ8IVG0_DERPT|nr:hypothetical protein DERP_012411 [Dermatophagoides pteronyssinus]
MISDISTNSVIGVTSVTSPGFLIFRMIFFDFLIFRIIFFGLPTSSTTKCSSGCSTIFLPFGVSSICSVVSIISETSTNSVIGVTSSVTSPGFLIFRIIFFGFLIFRIIFFGLPVLSTTKCSSGFSTYSTGFSSSGFFTFLIFIIFFFPSGVSSTSSIVSTISETSTNSFIGVPSSVTSPDFLIFLMIFFGFFISSTIT